MYEWYRRGYTGRLALFALFPAIIISVIHFSPILLGLPTLLLAALYLENKPKVSAVIVSIASVLMIHPLLGYFLIFFTKRKKEFGITALVSSILLLLLPLTIMSTEALWATYKVWFAGFRSIPTSDNLPHEFSLIHLIRGHRIMPEWLLRLFVINLFHYQLLPCLKSRKLNDPSVLLPLFGSSIVLFIGLFSGMNTPYTPVIAMSGTLAWMISGESYTKVKYIFGISALTSAYFGFMLGRLGIFVGTVSELVVLLPMSAAWFVNVLEIWRYIYRNKTKMP